MENLFVAAGFVLAAILLYRFHRPILDRLKRFDDENLARIAQQERDKSDPAAHIRHALEMADEQVEAAQEVEIPDARTGLPVTRFLFEAEMFATREEAEAARAARVGIIARRFYAELPNALAGGDTRSPLSARERAARRWKRTFH